MKKHRLRFVAALAAVAMGLAVAGCGTSSPTSGDVSAEPSDSGEITWWGWSPDASVAQHYISEFNKEYPNIKVTYRFFENVDYRNSLAPALDSGQGPDVFGIGAGGGATDTWGPYAVDLSSVAEKELGADWKDKFGANYITQMSDSEGRVVALPMGGMSSGFVWYNKDIFDKAGAEVPTDYDSWLTACSKIEAIGKQCFAMGAGGEDSFATEMFHSIANSVDPDFFINALIGKAKWNDPAGVETLQLFKKMQEDGIIPANALDGPQYPQANEAFMRGDAAMVQMGYWYTQYSTTEACKTAMEGVGVANPTCFVQLPTEFPDVAGKGNGSAYFGEVDYGLAVNADSPNQGPSLTFVTWLTTTQTGQQNVANVLDLLPGLQGVNPNWDSIELVDQDLQQPAIEELIKASGATTQTRQWQFSEKTTKALVVAIQQVLDPTINMSIEDIAAQLQQDSEPSTVGVE